MMDFDRFYHIETLSPSEVRKVQEELFKKQLDFISKNSKYYKNLFVRNGIEAGKIGLDNLSELPFTDKSDLENHNDDFLAVPLSKISDIVLSSGTTGKPTRMMYSDNDLARLTYNEKIAFSRVGVTTDDIVLLTCTMDRCFIAGLAYYSGIRALGAAAVRNGLNTVASHLEIIKRMNPTVIVGVPSFLHKLGMYMKDQGIDPGSTSVGKLICIGEPVRDSSLMPLNRGSDLEEIWEAKVFSTYASSEIVTTFCECSSQSGGHIHPPLGVVEIVDEGGSTLSPGEIGEVVVTPLMTEGMPLLRFKTGDVSFLIDECCACGRVSPRLGPVLGRKKQMIKYHGTTIYPQAIYSVLDEIQEISEYFVVVSSDYELSDNLQVHVSVKNGSYSARDISEKLQARLRVSPKVIIADEDTVRSRVYAESSRKPVRFIDRRRKADGMF